MRHLLRKIIAVVALAASLSIGTAALVEAETSSSAPCASASTAYATGADYSNIMSSFTNSTGGRYLKAALDAKTLEVLSLQQKADALVDLNRVVADLAILEWPQPAETDINTLMYDLSGLAGAVNQRTNTAFLAFFQMVTQDDEKVFSDFHL